MSNNMTEQKTWEEFRNCGMLWLINSILHLFGWAICMEFKVGDNGLEAIGAYPARCKFRGFDEQNNTKGYEMVTNYMKEHADELLKDFEE